MFPSVRTVRPDWPSVAGDSNWRKDGEKTSPVIWARSNPPVAFTDTWCWSDEYADHVAPRVPIWRNVSSLIRRYLNVSNGFDTAEPPPLNGFRTKVPAASVESRLSTPGVYAKQ